MEFAVAIFSTYPGFFKGFLKSENSLQPIALAEPSWRDGTSKQLIAIAKTPRRYWVVMLPETTAYFDNSSMSEFENGDSEQFQSCAIAYCPIFAAFLCALDQDTGKVLLEINPAVSCPMVFPRSRSREPGEGLW